MVGTNQQKENEWKPIKMVEVVRLTEELPEKERWRWDQQASTLFLIEPSERRWQLKIKKGAWIRLCAEEAPHGDTH